MRRPRRWKAGGWVSPDLRCWMQRNDQGVDLEIPIGHHISAPGRGEVIEHGHDGPFPGGFGDPYAIVRIYTGRFSGSRRERYRDYYIGHGNEDVPRIGLHFGPGDNLSKLTHSLNPGRGWVELGRWVNGGPSSMSDNAHNGSSIRHLFKNVWRVS